MHKVFAMKTLTSRLILVAMVSFGLSASVLRGESPPPATSAQLEQLRKDVEGIDKSVGGLADAIRNKSEDQTKILDRINGALSQIHSGVDNLNTRVPIDSFPIRLPEIRNQLDNLDSLIQQMESDLKKSDLARGSASTATGEKIAQITDALARIEKQCGALDANLGQLRNSLATDLGRKTEPSSRESSPWVPVLAVTVLFTFVVVVAAFISVRLQRAGSEADRDSLSVMIAQARDQVQAVVDERLKASSSELGRTLTGRELNSDEIISQMQRLAEKVERLASLELERTASPSPSSVPFDERPTIKGFVPAGPNISSSALWPPAFLDPAAPICRWRDMLEGHIVSLQSSALPVLATWLTIRTVAEKATASLPEIGDSVAAFSAACYSYWDGMQDLAQEDRQRANTDWAQALRTYLAPVAPKLEIREIVPGVRFDSSLMQTIKEGPGNHLNVAEVHSWAVLDRSGERPKVLNRARITTT